MTTRNFWNVTVITKFAKVTWRKTDNNPRAFCDLDGIGFNKMNSSVGLKWFEHSHSRVFLFWQHFRVTVFWIPIFLFPWSEWPFGAPKSSAAMVLTRRILQHSHSKGFLSPWNVFTRDRIFLESNQHRWTDLEQLNPRRSHVWRPEGDLDDFWDRGAHERSRTNGFWPIRSRKELQNYKI